MLLAMSRNYNTTDGDFESFRSGKSKKTALWMDRYIHWLSMCNRKMSAIDIKNNVNQKYVLKIGVTTINKDHLKQFESMTYKKPRVFLKNRWGYIKFAKMCKDWSLEKQSKWVTDQNLTFLDLISGGPRGE